MTGGRGAFAQVLGFNGAASGLSGDNGASTSDWVLFTSNPCYTTADLANWQLFNDAETLIVAGGANLAQRLLRDRARA